jgi:ABC-type transport system substrate-binding protein
MILEANPYFYKGEPAVKKLTIVFFADTNQAVSQLLSGTIDALGSETLGAGPELETVLQAAEEGRIQAYALASPTWEHVDMNIYVR